MRMVGWQYVDGGVLAYASLTFATLAAAVGSRHRYAFAALSGFFFTSMVIVHFGSAPLLLALIGYAVLIFDIRRLERKIIQTPFLCGTRWCRLPSHLWLT